MKQRLLAWLGIAVLVCSLLSGCQFETETKQAQTQPPSDTSPVYTQKNIYNEDIYFHQKHFWVPYGKVIENVKYYSRTAGEEKHFNILLPHGYKESEQYPVLYVLHGFYGTPEDHLHEYSYLQVLYGNLLYKKMAKPMLIVSVDMYTGKQAEREQKSQQQMRFIYDKVIEDIHLDVMPFVQQHYPVKTGRSNTAVAGVSEGGAKALCIGLKWSAQFGYIGAFAPDPGVVHTPYYRDTFWDNTVFETFPVPAEGDDFYYVYLAVGGKDPWNIGVTKAYANSLEAIGVHNQMDYVEGFGHDMKFWKACFYNFLSKVFR